jgi:hypothetical protein
MQTSTSNVMRRLMRLVVTAGFGKKAEVAGYFPGGKTGTAEKNSGHGYKKHANVSAFMSVFPMQAPRFAVYMMLDEPHGNASTGGYSTAGQVAAPAAGRVISRIGPILGLMPDIRDAPEIEQALAIPLQPPRGMTLGPIQVVEPRTDPAFHPPSVLPARIPVGPPQPDLMHRTEGTPMKAPVAAPMGTPIAAPIAAPAPRPVADPVAPLAPAPRSDPPRRPRTQAVSRLSPPRGVAAPPAGAPPVGAPPFAAPPVAAPPFAAPPVAAPFVAAPPVAEAQAPPALTAGSSRPGYPGPGYSGSGYSGPGYSGSGYPGTGYPAAAYPGPDAPAAGYPRPGYPGPGYPGPGYPGAGYPGAGYPGAGTPSGPPLPDLLHRTRLEPVGPLPLPGRPSSASVVVLSSASSIAP